MQQQFAAKWTAAAAAAAQTEERATLERAIRESATRKWLPHGQVWKPFQASLAVYGATIELNAY
ncbi:GM25575 [Drosophila sechellia]|uniref:GM25575 n=1 Tax=Drosophila sechellia TaxID=7238 RepID=B4HIM8_DROSE|nr:GM25575 [Drosophila sechellia]